MVNKHQFCKPVTMDSMHQYCIFSKTVNSVSNLNNIRCPLDFFFGPTTTSKMG